MNGRVTGVVLAWERANGATGIVATAYPRGAGERRWRYAFGGRLSDPAALAYAESLLACGGEEPPLEEWLWRYAFDGDPATWEDAAVCVTVPETRVTLGDLDVLSMIDAPVDKPALVTPRREALLRAFADGLDAIWRQQRPWTERIVSQAERAALSEVATRLGL